MGDQERQMEAPRTESWTTLRDRDVFDTRPTETRRGGRQVAMDDHAVRRIPANWRWTYLGAAFTSFGISTAMIYPLSGALYTETYGLRPALIAAVVTTFYAVAVCLFTVRHAINEGVNADLLGRSTFGYVGSAFNALLYAVLLGLFFAIEGSVMASALHEVVPAVPYWGWALVTSGSFILLGIFGMVLLTKVQWGTLVLYFVGLGTALYALVAGWTPEVSFERMNDWWAAQPVDQPLDWWTVLEASSAYVGLLGAILAVSYVDVARFIRREKRGFGGAVFVLINTVFPIIVMYTMGILMLAASGQEDPGVTLVRLLGPFGLAVTLITQVRVNLINVYCGTLGLANFARIFRFVPGRQFWIIPFLMIATVIILTPFRDHFGQVANFASVFLCAWVSTLIGERIFIRKRYQMPRWSEVRRAYLPSVNIVGVLAMWVPTAIACIMEAGVFGRQVDALAVPFAIVAPFVAPALIGAALGRERLRRCYIAREIVAPPEEHETLQCGVCEKEFHRSDFALCPFHDGIWICSYCCISELHCRTMCQSAEVPTSSRM